MGQRLLSLDQLCWSLRVNHLLGISRSSFELAVGRACDPDSSFWFSWVRGVVVIKCRHDLLLSPHSPFPIHVAHGWVWSAQTCLCTHRRFQKQLVRRGKTF